MPDVEVRPLVPDEWELWRDVRLAALAEAPHAFGSTLANWLDADEGRWRRRLEDVGLNLVAVIAGRPLGQVSADGPDADGAVELISMWVAPEARGMGVGDRAVRTPRLPARGRSRRRRGRDPHGPPVAEPGVKAQVPL